MGSNQSLTAVVVNGRFGPEAPVGLIGAKVRKPCSAVLGEFRSEWQFSTLHVETNSAPPEQHRTRSIPAYRSTVSPILRYIRVSAETDLIADLFLALTEEFSS